jgi:hypothetical protein
MSLVNPGNNTPAVGQTKQDALAPKQDASAPKKTIEKKRKANGKKAEAGNGNLRYFMLKKPEKSEDAKGQITIAEQKYLVGDEVTSMSEAKILSFRQQLPFIQVSGYLTEAADGKDVVLVAKAV